MGGYWAPEARRRYFTKKYNVNKEAGICTKCGKEKAEINFTKCKKCLEWQRKYNKERWAKGKKSGLKNDTII